MVVIMTGAITAIRSFRNYFRTRRDKRAEQLLAEVESSSPTVERKKASIHLPVGRVGLPTGSDARSWAGTTASGFGVAKRDELRRRGITPAQYARGTSHSITR